MTHTSLPARPRGRHRGRHRHRRRPAFTLAWWAGRLALADVALFVLCVIAGAVR